MTFPIDYNPPKTLYLVSLRSGIVRVTQVEVKRETEKMFYIDPARIKTLIGYNILGFCASRVLKRRVHSVETLAEALQWLWVQAVDVEAACKSALSRASDLVEQVQTVIDHEAKHPGSLLRLLTEIEAQQRVHIEHINYVSLSELVIRSASRNSVMLTEDAGRTQPVARPHRIRQDEGA